MSRDISHELVELQVYDKIPRELVDKLRFIHQASLESVAKLHSLREDILAYFADIRDVDIQTEDTKIIEDNKINIKA